MSKPAVEPQPLTTADIIGKMVEIRDERRKIGARDKELVAEWRSCEAELMFQMDEQGMEKASTGAGTASITKRTLPNVEDWDVVHAYIKENDSFFLLERRIAAAAFREIIQSGETVPGVAAYEQRQIALRKK